MTGTLVSLAYRSRATAGSVDEDTLASILSVAQRRNVADHLTGALAYADGYFIQVLEGPEASVVATMERIRSDVRHSDFEMVGPSPVKVRSFPDWSMARLSVEPQLKLALAPIFTDWDTHGSNASQLLAQAFEA